MNLMIVLEFVAIIGIVLCKLIEIKYEKARKYGNVFKRALNNLVFFNLPRCVISLSLIDWNKFYLIEIGLGCFQITVTILQLFLIFKQSKDYLIQIQI